MLDSILCLHVLFPILLSLLNIMLGLLHDLFHAAIPSFPCLCKEESVKASVRKNMVDYLLEPKYQFAMNNRFLNHEITASSVYA